MINRLKIQFECTQLVAVAQRGRRSHRVRMRPAVAKRELAGIAARSYCASCSANSAAPRQPNLRLPRRREQRNRALWKANDQRPERTASPGALAIQLRRRTAPTHSSTNCWPLDAMHCCCGRKQSSISRNCTSCGQSASSTKHGPGAGRPRAARPTCRAIAFRLRPGGRRSEAGATQSGQRRARLSGSLLRHERSSFSNSSTPAATSSLSSGMRKRCRRCSISSIKPVRPARATGPTASTRTANSGCRSWASAGTKPGPMPAGSANDCRPTPNGRRPAPGRSNRRPGRIAQRRYPWGESFDVRRAHLYGSGQQRPGAGR